MLRILHPNENIPSQAADVQLKPGSAGFLARYKEGLRRVGDFLEPDDIKSDQRKRQESLSAVLRGVDRKASRIEARLENETSPAVRDRLQRKLNILRAQKKKGLKALERLK